MTPETKSAALEALRFEVLALKPGAKVAYWQLMDRFDQGDSELSHALDAELHRLAKAGQVKFLEDDEGSESMVQRAGAKKKAAAAKKKKKKPAAKKKAPAKKKRK